MKPQPELIPDDVPRNEGEIYWWSSRAFRTMVRIVPNGWQMDAIASVCPYGQVGDLLWVRESYAVRSDGVDQILYKADYQEVVKMLDLPEINIKWKPSIHMFKCDARIWLEITGIRVERLQEITEEDAIGEGIQLFKVGLPPTQVKVYASGWPDPLCGGTSVDGFHHLWDSINAKRGYGWSENPWVWVIEFKRKTPYQDKDGMMVAEEGELTPAF